MSTLQAVLAYVVGPTLVAVLTYASARAAAQGSKHAADRTAAVEGESVQIEGYHKLVTDMRSDLDRLREDHSTLRSAHDELADHVHKLERQAIRDKSMIRHLIGYCRRMRDEIVRLGGVVPDPPGGLDIDDPLDPTMPI
jgi:predicted RNase H-like nuclease (RuvC/YqgF family)